MQHFIHIIIGMIIFNLALLPFAGFLFLDSCVSLGVSMLFFQTQIVSSFFFFLHAIFFQKMTTKEKIFSFLWVGLVWSESVHERRHKNGRKANTLLFASWEEEEE